MLQNISLNKKIILLLLLTYLLIRAIFFFLFPVYPDEIAVDWWLTSDINNAKNIIIACNKIVTKHSEIFNIFSGIEFFSSSLIYSLRIKSFFYYGIFILSIAYLYLKEKNLKYIYLIILTTIAPLSVTFILNRPESFIFYFLFYYLFYISNKNLYRIFLLLSLYFFILASFSHPKTLYFSLIYLFGINNRIPLILSIGLMNIFSYKYWQIRMSCSEPELLNFYSDFNINPIQIFYSYKEYFRDLYNHNFCTGNSFNNCRWSRFFSNSYFNSTSDIGVYSQITKNYLFENIPKLVLVFLGFFSLSKLIKHSLSNRRIFLLLLPLLVHLLHNKTQNFYDIAFWYIYIIALFIYLIPINYDRFSKVLIVFLLSFTLVLDYYYFYSDFRKGYQGPGLSTKFLRNTFKSLSENGIEKDNFKNYEMLVLDDSTFRYFDNKNKVLITYYSLRNNNFYNDIVNSNNIAIVTRCVFFRENKLEILVQSSVRINDTESICIYTKK